MIQSEEDSEKIFANLSLLIEQTSEQLCSSI